MSEPTATWICSDAGAFWSGSPEKASFKIFLKIDKFSYLSLFKYCVGLPYFDQLKSKQNACTVLKLKGL